MRYIMFGLLLLSSSIQAETYNECILENMKGVGSERGAAMVQKACRDKVLPYVPAKCIKEKTKNFFDPFDPPTAVHVERDQVCIDSCLNASYWSKTFGDCKP